MWAVALTWEVHYSKLADNFVAFVAAVVMMVVVADLDQVEAFVEDRLLGSGKVVVLSRLWWQCQRYLLAVESMVVV